MNKTKLKNKMMLLVQNIKSVSDIELAKDIILGIFPNALEVGTELNKDGYIDFDLLVAEDYTGAKPSKKEMLKEDKHYSNIVNMYGLAVYGSVCSKSKEVEIIANVAVDYKDKWGVPYTTTYDIYTNG